MSYVFLMGKSATILASIVLYKQKLNLTPFSDNLRIKANRLLTKANSDNDISPFWSFNRNLFAISEGSSSKPAALPPFSRMRQRSLRPVLYREALR